MSKTKSAKPQEQAMDPNRLARHYFEKFGQDNQKRTTLRYWQSEWWEWKDGRYIRVNRDDLKAKLTREVKRHVDTAPLLDSANRAFPVTGAVITNVTTHLTGMALVEATVTQPVWLGKEPTSAQYLAMRNGLVNIEVATTNPTLARRPLSPEWFSPVYVPYDYDPTAECPNWLKFLDEMLEGDQERIDILQEWFGYCLTPDTSFHKFLILDGEGENGKSVVLDVLTAMVGEANVSNVPLELFNERFQLTPTLGKLVNIAAESDNARLPEAQIKQFVSGDLMQVDRKGLDHIQARATARVVFATNNRPTIADKSNGLFRRILYIPFRVTPAKKNLQLAKEIVASEVGGILNWALKGRARLHRNQAFSSSQVSKRYLEEYRSSSNPAREFLEDCCELQLGAKTRKSDLYVAYTVWAKTRGHQPLNDSQFATEVFRKFKEEVTESRPTINGRRERVWNGLALITQEVAELAAA